MKPLSKKSRMLMARATVLSSSTGAFSTPAPREDVQATTAVTIAWHCGEDNARNNFSITRSGLPELHDGDWLGTQFDAGQSIADVAAEIGVHSGTVTHARRRFGIAATRAPKRTIDVDEVRRRLEAGESMAVIGRALGHTRSAISKVVRQHGLLDSV